MVVPHHVKIYYNGIKRIKNAIKIKYNFYRDLKNNSDAMSFERYRIAKKEPKINVQNVKTKLYKEIYEKLDNKETKNDIYTKLFKKKEQENRLAYYKVCLK